MEAMKRPAWIRGVLLLQLLYVLMLLAIMVYLLVLMQAPDPANNSDVAQGRRGLEIGTVVLGTPTLVALVAWFGLWKGKRWGWWLTMFVDLLFFAAFGYSVYDDGWHNIDGTLVALTVIALVLVAYLLMPKVRRFYLPRGGAELPACGGVVG
jgi:hypothetical protein